MRGQVTITVDKTPPSLNTWLSKHWRQRDRDKRQWQTELNAECHRNMLPPADRITASIYFRFRDGRKRDHDNYVSTLSKCLGDALRPDFIQDDDSARFQVIHGEILPDKGPPKTVVVLEWEQYEQVAAA